MKTRSSRGALGLLGSVIDVAKLGAPGVATTRAMSLATFRAVGLAMLMATLAATALAPRSAFAQKAPQKAAPAPEGAPAPGGSPSIVCVLASEGGTTANGVHKVVSAATFAFKDSCEPRKMCVMDVKCAMEGGKSQASSVVCLANSDGSCPAVSDCMANMNLIAALPTKIAAPLPTGKADPGAVRDAGSASGAGAIDPGSVRN